MSSACALEFLWATPKSASLKERIWQGKRGQMSAFGNLLRNEGQCKILEKAEL
jgi:hypothetical protein